MVTVNTVNGRTKEQQTIVNHIIENMSKVGKEKLQIMYEMEYDLYSVGALTEKEHEYIRKQLKKYMGMVL